MGVPQIQQLFQLGFCMMFFFSLKEKNQKYFCMDVPKVLQEGGGKKILTGMELTGMMLHPTIK